MVGFPPPALSTITAMMDNTTPIGTCARSMFFGNFSLLCSGNEDRSLLFDIEFNDRWLINPTMRDICPEHPLPSI